MKPLEALVQEVVLRMEAAGGKVWISPELTDYMKMAFLEALLSSPGLKELEPVNCDEKRS